MSDDLSFTSFSGTTRPTAFGLYDSNADFSADADKLVYFVQRNLGSPILESELDVREIWTCFEQATMEYSQEVNQHHARNILLDLLGQGTGSLSGSENVFPVANQTEFARKQAIQYSAEFGTGGPFRWLTSSIELVADKQKYDLWAHVSASLTGTNAGKGITVRKIHHYEPFASYRFFDTTSVLNFMGNSLGFESYSPETIFYLLPIWEDVLRGTQLELNQRVRRSNYSFDLNGHELVLYPTPTKTRKLYFEYTIGPRDPVNDVQGHQAKGVISNLSNVAFGHLNYSQINSIGKNWIYRMTVAMCKEVLGLIRSKYQNIPVLPDGITLNGGELVSQGREDMQNLRQELRETLEAMSYLSLMKERNEMEVAVRETNKQVPLLIYISH